MHPTGHGFDSRFPRRPVVMKLNRTEHIFCSTLVKYLLKAGRAQVYILGQTQAQGTIFSLCLHLRLYLSDS